ncbi:hypothetical protein J4050_02050 [Winogradskyella sp. DF17]|uniref:Adenosine deaminase domain-containing protein n=1 Tax=Winogradskyella pelagia TaxID=2819984 RepID=A0ABS3SZP4_9FLAO|nr:hypothetical protein [Winogradskyella sp. DF17]MBO3115509.1 hypothetical protein [Winogradskyella sp. DF17]
MKDKIDDIKNLPKADVHNHLHLSGSQELFKQRYPTANINFPTSYNGLNGMIEFIYGHLNNIMTTDKDVVNFMEIAIESAIQDNVSLLEASVDIGLARFFNDSIENVIEEVKRLKEKYNPQIQFKPDFGVNKDLDLEKVYNYSTKCIDSGVFNGIDLYGQEAGKDLNPFIRIYDMAKDKGIKTKVHIGEFSDHTSIEKTILLLNPDEIQHGIRAVDSQKTMDMILERDIRLNICPSSNKALGAVADIETHPVRTLFDYGIKVTINTDDLILFNASVSDEYIKLINKNVFSLEEIDVIRINAF